jgi:hypothetical protein
MLPPGTGSFKLPEIPGHVFGCAAVTGGLRALVTSIDADVMTSYTDFKQNVATLSRDLPQSGAPSLAMAPPMPRLGTYRISAVQQY